MKKRLLIIAWIIFLAFGSVSNAMSQWVFLADPFRIHAHLPAYGGAESLAGDEKNIFAGGYTGLVRSTDNGKTWFFLDSAEFHNEEITVLLTDKDNLYVGTRGLYRSQDNGNTFIRLDSGIIWRVYAIAEFDSVLLINCAYQKDVNSSSVTTVLRSTDNGNSWVPSDSGIQLSQELCFAQVGDKFFSGSYKGIYRSNDGLKWTEVDTNFRFSVSCLAELSGNLFAGTDSGIFISADSGLSWKKILKVVSQSLITSIIVHDSTIFADDYFSGTFRSTDNGATWYNVTSNLTSRVHALFPIGDYLFAGANAGIYQRSFSELASVPTLENIYKTDVTLFPNPATSLLSIRNAPENLIGISILNVLGLKVIEVAASHSAEFTIDISKLPAGMYYAKFETAGGVEVRKIIKE